MPTYNIFQGGNAVPNSTSAMFPSAVNPSPVNTPRGNYSYADHQKSRFYSVTRRIDARGYVPGQLTRGYDNALTCFLRGGTYVVGDILRTHLLLPNTVLTGVSFQLENPVAGLTFDVIIEGPNPVTVGTITATTTPVNPITGQRGMAWVDQPQIIALLAVTRGLITSESYLGLRVTALPVPVAPLTIGQSALNDLVVSMTAHVLDLDNGNA
jgi:hypothetical protein